MFSIDFHLNRTANKRSSFQLLNLALVCVESVDCNHANICAKMCQRLMCVGEVDLSEINYWNIFMSYSEILVYVLFVLLYM